MAPSSKENEVLIAAAETAAPVSAATASRPEDTSAGSRPQPVALEVPVTVNGARTVEGSDKREPFSETTKTVLVFGNGAVIRLGSPVSAGQLLFLTNEKTKKEVVCQVVKSKNYKSVSGYVELEFTEPVVGFWGMRFPSDRLSAQSPSTASTLSPAPRSVPVAPVSALPRPVSPVLSAAPAISAPTPALPHAERRPADPRAAVVPARQPQTPSLQNAAVPAPPIAKKLDVPVIPAPAVSSSLASSLASLLSAPELPPTSPLGLESKQPPPAVAADNSSEELKLQAARLQEQLSSMLFSAVPAAKPAAPAAVVPALDPKAVSGVALQVLAIAKSEPAPVKTAPLAKTPPAPPLKSSLDSEEVKIPSWLEPLARNAAAPVSAPEIVERERTKHAVEVAGGEEHSVEHLSLADAHDAPEVELAGIGSLLPLDESVATRDRFSGGSRRGVLFGAIAAGVLVAAGGGWYLLHPANAVQGTTSPIASAPGSPAVSTPAEPSITQPATQPLSQNAAAASEPISHPSATPVSNTPIYSAPLSKVPANPQPVPVTRDNTRGAGTTIPAAAMERISRPPAEPQPKKPALGEVHLASPTMNRPASAGEDGESAPTLATGADVPNVGGLDSGLASGSGNQPAAPEMPLPIGGDVRPAKLIGSVPPVYPLLAKNQHVSGDVLIDALIDANGRVTTMKVISGPTLLQQAAKDAVRLWKYQPATLDGKPVPMHLNVTLQFRPQ